MFFPMLWLFIEISELIGLNDTVKDILMLSGVFIYVGFALFLVDRVRKQSYESDVFDDHIDDFNDDFE